MSQMKSMIRAVKEVVAMIMLLLVVITIMLCSFVTLTIISSPCVGPIGYTYHILTLAEYSFSERHRVSLEQI